MTLFSFLMIIQSIIIGLGISELLTGLARVLRTGRAKEFCIAHVAILVAVFLALLQTFWESWGLSELPVWTFPAMLLMLGTPVLLHLIAHVLFPSENDNIGFTEYYFSKSRLVFSLASVTVLVSVLFKPIAFDMPLFIIDNLSSLFSFIICALLAISKNKWLHRILVPVGTVIIILDTLAISYQIH